MPSIKCKMKIGLSSAKFLNLDILAARRQRREFKTPLHHLIYRNPRNAMAYMLATSFHARHIAP